MQDTSRKLTKRTVDAAAPRAHRYVVWDPELPGFGLRVETSGSKSYFVRYRSKVGGSNSPKRFLTIGRHGRPFGELGASLTADSARAEAKRILGAVANGADPAGQKTEAKNKPTVRALFDEYMRLHVEPKLKPKTAKLHRSTFGIYVLPKWGQRRAEDLRKSDLLKLHAQLVSKQATSNRILGYVSAMYSWAGENGYVVEGFNPASGIARFRENKRERYLSADEMVRLGSAIREAETLGIPWEVDEDRPKAKYTPKSDKRHTPISPQAAAALRLLLFTGARLREILHLQWQHVDVERAALFLPDSKTGKKTIYLNAPALAVLEALPRTGTYVFPGEPRKSTSNSERQEQPRHDLKRPWEGIRRIAKLEGVRLHDLRHTHASFGVGGGLGLPIIAKLLGHAQIRTTERYAHLDADPVRLGSELIGKRIAEALGE